MRFLSLSRLMAVRPPMHPPVQLPLLGNTKWKLADGTSVKGTGHAGHWHVPDVEPKAHPAALTDTFEAATTAPRLPCRVQTFPRGLTLPPVVETTPLRAPLINQAAIDGWAVASSARLALQSFAPHDLTSPSVAISSDAMTPASTLIALDAQGFRVVALREGRNAVYDPNGLDVYQLIGYRQRTGTVYGFSRAIEGAEVGYLNADVLLSSSALSETQAAAVRAHVVVESTDSHATRDAEHVLWSRGVPVVSKALTEVNPQAFAAFFEVAAHAPKLATLTELDKHVAGVLRPRWDEVMAKATKDKTPLSETVAAIIPAWEARDSYRYAI